MDDMEEQVQLATSYATHRWIDGPCRQALLDAIDNHINGWDIHYEAFAKPVGAKSADAIISTQDALADLFSTLKGTNP